MTLATSSTYHLNIFEVKAQHRLAGFFKKTNAGRRSILDYFNLLLSAIFCKSNIINLSIKREGPPRANPDRIKETKQKGLQEYDSKNLIFNDHVVSDDICFVHRLRGATIGS